MPVAVGRTANRDKQQIAIVAGMPSSTRDLTIRTDSRPLPVLCHRPCSDCADRRHMSGSRRGQDTYQRGQDIQQRPRYRLHFQGSFPAPRSALLANMTGMCPSLPQ